MDEVSREGVCRVDTDIGAESARSLETVGTELEERDGGGRKRDAAHDNGIEA